MADFTARPIDPVTGLEEVTITSIKSDVNYNVNKMLSLNLLKSSKFTVRFNRLPSFFDIDSGDLKQLSLLCDSVEFPGQTIAATDYRIPGKLKVKVPFAREINEISFTFYMDAKAPVYSLFYNWITNISYTNSINRYFDEIVGQLSLIQFEDVGSSYARYDLTPYMKVNLIDAYPLTLQSLPANWADDGFHKVNVSFFFRDLEIVY